MIRFSILFTITLPLLFVLGHASESKSSKDLTDTIELLSKNKHQLEFLYDQFDVIAYKIEKQTLDKGPTKSRKSERNVATNKENIVPIRAAKSKLAAHNEIQTPKDFQTDLCKETWDPAASQFCNVLLETIDSIFTAIENEFSFDDIEFFFNMYKLNGDVYNLIQEIDKVDVSASVNTDVLLETGEDLQEMIYSAVGFIDDVFDAGEEVIDLVKLALIICGTIIGVVILVLILIGVLCGCGCRCCCSSKKEEKIIVKNQPTQAMTHQSNPNNQRHDHRVPMYPNPNIMNEMQTNSQFRNNYSKRT